MDINELESFKLSDAVAFHKELNPKLWEDEKLDPEVRDQLMLIAEDFVEYLGISNLKVKDVTISGSNAAYSYTPHSDLDLHVLVDFNELPNNEVYQELFTAKKTLYNDAHDITVREVPVELYVQDTNNPVQSLGEYSIVHDKWIRIPKKRRANFDQAATKLKYEKLGELIELALKTKDPKRVDDTIALVKRYRKSGLDKHGEFGPENLAYKAARKQGLVKALHDLKVQLHTEKLSIDEYANEDYDPNGPPPGPEFKPTMPAGTVRVDVSDVYDWYKLGQHISNLKGLGKHDFGKGPPSTIMAFGSEPEEHKYIQDLEKTGLTTTDIDPVDPNQPKGMKRQKTDPTFNVNETDDRTAAVLKIQKHLNKKYGANLDLDGKLGPLTLKSINKFMPRAKAGLADEPNKTTAVQGKKLKEASDYSQYESKIEDFVQSLNPDDVGVEQLNETIHESQLINLISKKAAAIIFKMLRKKESQIAKILVPDLKRQRLEIFGISAEQLGVPHVNDPVLNTVLSHSNFRVVNYINPSNPGTLASYYPNTHDITVYYPSLMKYAARSGYETEEYLAKTIAHEILHAVDNLKSRGKALRNKGAYATRPQEINARFQEALMLITMEFDRAKREGKTLSNKNLPRFINDALEHENISEFLPKTGNRYKQLAKRAYKFFEAELNNPKKEQPLSIVKRAMNFIFDKPTAEINEASGYIPSAKEKNDPRFKTALTVDVRPDAIKKNAKAFGFKTSRAGIPPQARADGKIAEDLMREFKSFLGEQQEEMFPGYDKEHKEKRLSNWLAKSWGVQNGKPQTFYHATTKDFDTFNTSGTGFASALGMAYEVERHGSFFAVDPKFAEDFIEDPNTGRVKEGGRVLPVHLSIQSPIDLRDNALSRMVSDEETADEFKANGIDLRSVYNHFYELERWELFDGPEGAEFVDNLQKLGFDGAIINEAIPNNSNAKSGQVWVAFSPNQVKSVYNRGSFSPDDNRLMREDQKNTLPKIGYHVTATKNLPIIQQNGIKADKRGNSYVWDSREMAEWFKDFQNDEGQDRTILKIDMSGLDANPDPEAEDMSEWSSKFKPGTNGGAWIISGPIPPDKIKG